MELDRATLIQKKAQFERERDQLLAELNLRIGAIRAIDDLIALMDVQADEPVTPN